MTSQGSGLRATTSRGETRDDPPEEELITLFEGLTAVDDSFVLERPAAARGDRQTYLSVRRVEDGFVLETRAGAPGTQRHALTVGVRDAYADVATWALELDRPLLLAWSPGYPPVV